MGPDPEMLVDLDPKNSFISMCGNRENLRTRDEYCSFLKDQAHVCQKGHLMKNEDVN